MSGVLITLQIVVGEDSVEPRVAVQTNQVHPGHQGIVWPQATLGTTRKASTVLDEVLDFADYIQEGEQS